MADIEEFPESLPPGPGGGGAPAPPSTSVVEIEIRRLYQQYLRREPTASELAMHRQAATTQGLGYLTTLQTQLQAQAPQAPTTPTPPTTPGTPPGATTPYSDAAFQAILQKYPATNDGIRQGVAEANRVFGSNISIIEHPDRLDKVRLADGRTVDVMIGAGGPNPSWGWIVEGPGGGGGHGSAPVDFNQVSIDPSFLEPWTGRAPTGPHLPTFESPGEFQAPTGESVLQDPSYLWRLEQGKGALENSAAAKGTLNSGGTLVDILNYGQKAASQEYSNVWDRSFGVWNAKWGNALGKFQADKSVSDSAYNRAWQAYTDSRDTHYRNQSEPFSKLFQVASLGASAAR